MGIKDEEMEGLSDEERAALEDDDDDSDILKGIAGDSGDEDEDGEEGESGDGVDDDGDDADDSPAAAKPDVKPAAGTDAATAAEEPAVPAVEEEFRPEFKAIVPEGLAEKLTDLETQSTDLLVKFKEGDIDLPEFMTQKAAIDDEKLKLMLADGQAKWAEGQNTDTREQRWKWEQERFFGSQKAEIYKDPIILAALDASVKQLAADNAHAKKPAAFFLEEADRQIRKRFNMGTEPVTKVVEKPNRQPDLSKVPKTLAQLPAAEMAETGDVEFAYLDKLNGIALEMELRKMAPEQEARYLGAV